MSCSSVFMCTRKWRSKISWPVVAGAAIWYLARALPTSRPSQRNSSNINTVTIVT